MWSQLTHRKMPTSPGNTRNIRKWRGDGRGVSNPPRHSTPARHRRRKMLPGRSYASKKARCNVQREGCFRKYFSPLRSGDGGDRQPGERLMLTPWGLGRGRVEGAGTGAVMGKAPCLHPSAHKSREGSPSEKPQGLRYSHHTHNHKKVLPETPCHDSPPTCSFPLGAFPCASGWHGEPGLVK